MSQLKVTKNKDNTITVVAGNYKEYISIESKSQMELLDCIRWAAITGGLVVDEASLWEQVRSLE
jgi:hypothetical protein